MTASRALLIIGAGPFGLSLAAQAKDLQIDTTVVGKPMAFWKRNMPPGMILRSGVGWHLDPHTIAAYIESQGISPEEAEPLSLARYLEYAAWFQEQKGISVRPNLVDRLDLQPSPTPHFSAVLDDGTAITADAVVVATGFGSFEHVPEELTARLPAGRFQHTRDLNDLAQFAGQRCLIIGGRQSAFGSAALLRENGAAQVHVSHRHPPRASSGRTGRRSIRWSRPWSTTQAIFAFTVTARTLAKVIAAAIESEPRSLVARATPSERTTSSSS